MFAPEEFQQLSVKFSEWISLTAPLLQFDYAVVKLLSVQKSNSFVVRCIQNSCYKMKKIATAPCQPDNQYYTCNLFD